MLDTDSSIGLSVYGNGGMNTEYNSGVFAGGSVKTENVNLEQLFTGSFSNTNINLALQSISTPSQIKYELEGNNVLFYAENAP